MQDLPGRPARARVRPALFSPAVFLGAALVGGCAARTAPPPTRVDLSPAREALENARLLTSAQEANECFVKAEGHLNEAESLAETRDPEKSRQAEWLARLSLVESHCATSIAKVAETQRAAVPAPSATRGDEAELRAKWRAAEEERKKLEERVAVLQRTLEVTETEVVRAKAKLKGLETKAEASSAIAEARILMRRLQEDKGRSSPSLNMSQDKLDLAVEKLQEGDYSLAAFYALQAQEILEQVRRGVPVDPDPERAPPKKQYVVQVASANIRKVASKGGAVVGKAPKGAILDALGARSEWVKVRYNGIEGWVSRSLLE